MSGYIDLHAHVLPGIDDGPANLEDALAMLRAAAQSGTTTIAATPHLRSDFPRVDVHELADRCEELHAELSARGIEIRVVCGAEVSLVWALEADGEELRLATYGQRGTDLLIETPTASVVGLDALLYGLRSGGLRIILAHPERSPEFQRDPALAEALARQGVLLQVNAGALLGRPRRSPASRLARHLLVTGAVHAVASDGHRAASWRPVTELADGAQAAGALAGDGRASWLTREAPAAIVAGRALPSMPALAPPRRRGFPFGGR